MVARSPGIYPREVDLSNYAPDVSMSVFGVIGPASKGPTNEITLITDEATLYNTFGPPSAGGNTFYGLHTAIIYLKKGRQLKFVRVAHYDTTADDELQDGAAVNIGAIEAVSSGSWGNSITVRIAVSTYDAATYKITVSYGGVVVETYDLINVTDESNANYITTRINDVSDYITITGLAAAPTTLQTGTYTLAGGGDGLSGLSEADYIGIAGTPPTIPTTGLQLFANAEVEDVDIIAIPDSMTDAVIAAIQTLVEARADCVGLIGVPYGKSVQDAVEWSNGLGTGGDDPGAAINSTYLAVYYPWVQVYDSYSGTNVWIPPEGFVAATMAYTDEGWNVFDAPAGEQRGLLTSALDLEHSATQGERDYMYCNGNIVNPFIIKPGVGAVIWGQRTAARIASARDRLNVRRLLCYLKRSIVQGVRPLVFEPNDEETWAQLRNIVEPVLADISGKGGLEYYNVVCDETTNTALLRSRNQMLAKIFITPTKTAEEIMLDFVVLASGAATVTEL